MANAGRLVITSGAATRNWQTGFASFSLAAHKLYLNYQLPLINADCLVITSGAVARKPVLPHSHWLVTSCILIPIGAFAGRLVISSDAVARKPVCLLLIGYSQHCILTLIGQCRSPGYHQWRRSSQTSFASNHQYGGGHSTHHVAGDERLRHLQPSSRSSLIWQKIFLYLKENKKEKENSYASNTMKCKISYQFKFLKIYLIFF